MSTAICPCGIAAADCDYHKPAAAAGCGADDDQRIHRALILTPEHIAKLREWARQLEASYRKTTL